MTGHVRLQRDQDVIVADRLDAEMTVTPDGRNIPRIVDAAGDVLAQQGRRLIRSEQMHVTMGLVPGTPRTVVQGDLIVKEAKPHVGIESLDAQGRVFVHDPENDLKIRDAHRLSCVIQDGSQLARATIDAGEGGSLAKVRAGETAIHGRHIEIDVPKEAISVPGPGRAWMITQQDFGGRKLNKPSPVKITWSDEMYMRGEKNYGVFLGHVRSKSEAFSLACDKLTVRLANAPPLKSAPRPSLLDHVWLARLMAARNPTPPKESELALGPRKRPTYVLAEGHAEALSSSHAPNTSDGRPGRLLSRLQIAGQQIAADLARQHMSVPCEGTLLIEDYQFDSMGKKTRPSGPGPRKGPLMSSAQGEGPSQTLVAWQSSMDYYVDQSLVAFDKEVTMRHRSGQQIVLRDELAAGMGLDPSLLRNVKAGRLAELSAGYLLLEFRTAPMKDGKSGEDRPLVRATDLERLIAKHAVHLQEGTKSLMGEYVQYLANTDEVQVEGSPGMDARIFDQDERDQRLSQWRGPILIWNRKTNRVEAPQATIRTTRR
jgi:lipopolysaccharide export system protein LptA